MSRISRTAGSRKPGTVTEAIALAFDPQKDRAPVVVAKGRGPIARRIVEKAEAYGVSVVSDPIALEALRFLDIGQEIPPKVYHLVAEILAFVYSLSGRSATDQPVAGPGAKAGAPGEGAPSEREDGTGRSAAGPHPTG